MKQATKFSELVLGRNILEEASKQSISQGFKSNSQNSCWGER